MTNDPVRNMTDAFRHFARATVSAKYRIATKTVPEVLDRTAYKVLRDADKIVPIKSSALKNSGRVEKKANHTRDIVYGGQGTGVDYAQYVEYGTMYQRAQPYLRPAMLKAMLHFTATTKSEFAKAFKRWGKAGSTR